MGGGGKGAEEERREYLFNKMASVFLAVLFGMTLGFVVDHFLI